LPQVYFFVKIVKKGTLVHGKDGNLPEGKMCFVRQ